MSKKNGIKVDKLELIRGTISFVHFEGEMKENTEILEHLKNIFEMIHSQIYSNGQYTANNALYDKFMLTKTIQKSLKMNSKNLMLVNISMNENDQNENLQILNYATNLSKLIVSSIKKK